MDNDQNEKIDRVYILSEMGFDTDFFNEEAFSALLKFMEQDKDISGVIVDGAITRLDRPEVLNEALTYWNKSKDECDEASLTIPYHEQYQHMLKIQMKILKENLLKIKAAAPEANIAFCIPTDDTHFSLSALIAELLRYHKDEVSESIKSLMSQIKDALEKTADLEKKLKKNENSKLKNRKKTQKLLKKDIKDKQKTLDKLKEKLEKEHVSLSLFRVKKSRPEHQQKTHEFVGIFLKGYTDLCNELKIKLVTHPSTLKFGAMVINYSHSGHRTWTIVRNRDKKLVLSKNGRLHSNEVNKLVDMFFDHKTNKKNTQVQDVTLETLLQDKDLKKDVLKEAKKERIDVFLETGHNGLGFKQTQRINDIPDAVNFQNQASYDPTVAKEHITFVMALPFEDQDKISGYKKGKKPARMKLGIPLNTTNSEIFQRYNTQSVSGLTIIQKDHATSRIHTEWIQFKNFKNGSALNQPKEYAVIFVSSDEHKGSPEENLLAQDGFLELYRQNASKPFSFRGKPAFAKGFISGGDTGEANSAKWEDRYHRRPNPTKLLPNIVKKLINLKQDNPEDVYKTSMEMMSYALAGSVENMRVILERVAAYYMGFFEISLEKSKLKAIHVSVPGNHADDVLRKLGFKESDFFVVNLNAQGHPVFEVGLDKHFVDCKVKEARVYIGGYSSARIINVESYGLSVDDKAMFGPINLLVQHDPKGSGFNGIVDAGKSVNADLTLAGHTHENYVKLYKTGNNTFSVAYRLATLQGVTATEKYYAGGVPRTQAGHWFIMPMAGDFAEMAITADYLNKMGKKYVDNLIEDDIKDKKNKK